MSDLNWVTDVETDISIKSGVSKAKAFHYEHIFLHLPPTPQSERNTLEKMLSSKLIESYRKRSFLIYNGGDRYKILSKSRAHNKSILDWN